MSFGTLTEHANYNQWLGDSSIRDGIRSGRLSRDEVRELTEEQRNIRAEEVSYRRDGFLSPYERNDLRDDINDYNKKLQHELNDGERAWW